MTSAPVLYQEARISTSLFSSSPSILPINSAGGSAASSSGAGRKRPLDEISGHDEESFARKYLATEGSVFFRAKDKAPRSFLWRVLNERQLLEVQCVDLVLDQKHAKAQSWLTFHITFPNPIIPSGVALADVEGKDALNIYVLTSANDLYTISLRRDLLLRETVPADFDPHTCVRKYSPSSLSYKHPYRLIAASSTELFISLHDGSLLRLTRENFETASQWRETHFSEGGWSGTLKRSFTIPIYKPRTVRYANFDLYEDAIAAVAKSPDDKHIWTLGLDHVLKVWSADSGNVVRRQDLVAGDQEPEDRKKHTRHIMSPEQGTLLQLVRVPPPANSRALSRFNSDAISYSVVVHSPQDHQFKFFSIRNQEASDDGAPIEIVDLVPGTQLIPPIDDLMNTNIWHLEQFAVLPGPAWEESQLWLRVRSGAVCRTFMLNFDLSADGGEDLGVSRVFRSSWTAVDSSSQSIEQLREFGELNKLDAALDGEAAPSERWIDFLFYPGRFSEASLETALQIYRKGRNLPAVVGRGFHANAEPLKERIISAIAAKIMLHRLPTELPDFSRYQSDLQSQWTTFLSLLTHLHKRRHESIGFAFDEQEGLPWTVCADYVAPIRTCSGFELTRLNVDLLMADQAHRIPDALQERIFPTDQADPETGSVQEEDAALTSRVMFVARQLRRYFSATSQEKLKSIARRNALEQAGETSPEDVLQAIYTECHFQDEIRDDDYELLNSAADEIGGLGSLTLDHLLTVLESSADDPGAHGQDLGEKLGRYGEHMSTVIVRESLLQTQAVLLDILALLVLLHCDLEQDEISPDLRPFELYDAIVLRLKNTELLLWLNSNMRRELSAPGGRVGELRTLYEYMFAQDWQPKPDRNHALYGLPEVLTGWSKHWAFDLNTSDWGGITEHILADLLKHKQIELALDFEKFLPETPFISYLRGRLYLTTGDYNAAGFAFKEAADDMGTRGCPKNNLLSPEEYNFFQRGPVFYYQHVSALFEKLKNFSYTAEFAQRGLDHINEPELDQALMEVDFRKSQRDSPLKDRLGDTMEEIRILKLKDARDELLNRRFNALVQSGHYALAFDVLAQVKNPALQKSDLQQLVKACIERDALATLLDLPFMHRHHHHPHRDHEQHEPDPGHHHADLAAEADAILLQLAKKSMASGLPSGPPYHQILFAFRTQRADYRGAAAILYEHLEHLRATTRAHSLAAIPDPDDLTLPRLYALLINTLASAGDDDAWLLADPIPGLPHHHHHHHTKDGDDDDAAAVRRRKLVTLADVRREYAAELDRRSEVLLGRFPLVAADDSGGGDEMDVF